METAFKDNIIKQCKISLKKGKRSNHRLGG